MFINTVWKNDVAFFSWQGEMGTIGAKVNSRSNVTIAYMITFLIP